MRNKLKRAAKNTNSIKSLGAEFIKKLIWVIILWL